MNKCEDRYQKEVDFLVNRSFPRLKGKIKIKEKEMSSKAMARYTITGRIIILSKLLRKYPITKLRGLFVHELAHFDINEKKEFGWFATKLDIIYCNISKKHREKIEKEADMLTIKRGYRKDLIKTRKLLKPKNSQYYLNLREIEEAK